jgi:hypothetical protein
MYSGGRKHYHLRSCRGSTGTRRTCGAFGTGERIVFWSTPENFEAARRCRRAHDLFSGPPPAGYDQAALV